MSSDVKVSIIIPCYNKGQYVKEAVESALNQTYQNIEIICIDDASTDNSKTVLKELAEKYDKIVLIEENENIGVCRARNKAIEIASGEYILPLDADDTIEPTYVEKALDVLKTNPSIDIVSCCTKRFDKQINKENYHIVNEQDIAIGKEIIICSAMMKKSDFIAMGGYREELNRIGGEDWDLWLTFLENGYKICKLNEYLYNYKCCKNSRTKVQISNKDYIYKELLNKHKNLFLTNSQIITHLFECQDYKKIKIKYKKYKKLFNIFLSITILETLIIFAYLVCKLLGGV